MIKAVTFDLDGVYFINGKSNFIANLEKQGVSRKEAERIFLKSDEMNKAYKEGKMTDKEFWSFAVSEWKINFSIEKIIKMLIDGYEVNEEVVEVVKRIREKGYKTCICSNNFPARINGLEERFGFLNNFDVITVSYQVGATKPSIKIFKDLVSKSGVKPEEIVFADDNEQNLKGAKEIGIQTFFYKGFNNFLDKLKEFGVKW